jgi:hypothetical protein
VSHFRVQGAHEVVQPGQHRVAEQEHRAMYPQFA